MDAVKARLEGLEQDVTRVVGEMQRAADRLAEAQKALARAEAAQAVVDEAAAGHEAYCAAEAALTDLDRQRDARDKVRAEQQRDEKRLAQIDEQLAGLARHLETIAEAEAAMVELRPRVEKQDGFEHALAEARHDAERLKSQQRALAEAEAGLAALSQRLSEVQMGVARRDQVQADLDQLRAALKPVDAEYEAVSQNLAALRADLGNLSDRQKQLAALVGLAERDLKQERERLTEWEQKQSKLQGETAHRPRLEAESETVRCGLEELRERSDGLTGTAARHRAELAHISTQLQALTSTDTGQCPVCERELTPEHRDELLARQQARQEELNEALAAVQTEQQAVQQEMRKQEKALRTLDDRLKNLPRSDEVEAAVAQVTAHQTACDERESRLRDVQAEVAELTIRMEMLGAELTEIETQQGELDRTRQAKQDEVDTLERELRELPSRADVESLMTQIEQQQASMAEKTSSVEALSGAPEEVARWEQALEALGDPRSEYRRQEGTAGRRVTVEREQGDAEDHKAQVEMALAAHKEALHMYDGLDDRVAEARDTRSAHEQDHQRYLEHIREAATLSERRDVVNIRSDGADAAVERHREVVAARDAVAAEFDADVYATLLEKHATLDRELAELRGRLGQQRQRQAVLEAEIAQLRETRSRLDKVRDEHVEHRELLTVLDHLREVLRSAGPEITKTLVGVISHQAEDLYMDIMHDYTARLRWTDDYDIELLAGGRIRTFQQLSGGEQMAAALAVRLALLREISAINIAFFDEPTANLDRDRRANLAAQILNVRGFAQLFVISHDDTFEQDTDCVIRVAKRNGASEVEV